jgi:transcriptional regulator with XRE-family HTH domain
MSPTLGQRVRALRKEHGLSQADLAGDLVSPSYVSLIEAGRRSPEREVLEGLADKLGCSVLYLESGIAPEEITELRLQLQFAEIAYANGSIEEAHEQFDRLASASSGEIRLGALWGLARTEEAMGNLHGSLKHRDVLLQAARAGEPGAPKLISMLNGRCRLYRDVGDFARSIEVGEEGLREVRALGLQGTEDEIMLASTLVGSYWARGDLFSAQHLVNDVIERATKLGSSTAQGNAYWNASLIAAARGQLTLALDLATKTLALLSESSSQERSLGLMRSNYGMLLLQCDPPQLDEAEAMLCRAHDTLTELSLEHDVARCETEMARCALLRGDTEAALRIAAQSIARCGGSGSTESQIAHVVHGLALVLAGQVDAGADEASSAADCLVGLDARLDAAQAFRELAEVLLGCGRSEQAIEALKRSAACAGVRSAVIPARVSLVSGRVSD